MALFFLVVEVIQRKRQTLRDKFSIHQGQTDFQTKKIKEEMKMTEQAFHRYMGHVQKVAEDQGLFFFFRSE